MSEQRTLLIIRGSQRPMSARDEMIKAAYEKAGWKVIVRVLSPHEEVAGAFADHAVIDELAYLPEPPTTEENGQ